MQRLKGLKQLGTAEFVYINCNHSRLEHSLGVAYLAATLASRIGQAQPALRCRPIDVLCVELAGLLHDIGHGPFSHHYERFVQHQRKKPTSQSQFSMEHNGTPLPDIPANWHHEQASIRMIHDTLRHLGLAINYDALDAPLQQLRPGTPTVLRASDGTELSSRDMIFVMECIAGELVDVDMVHGHKLGPGYHGRCAPYHAWLYDIVANHAHGLDVDKVDYFARDQRRALRDSGEIDKVMIEEAVVAWAQVGDTERLTICYPRKLVTSCMDFFKTRFKLHSNSMYMHTRHG